jgi:hypothetical protein
MVRPRAWWFGWWYVSLGAGFVLLGLRAWLLGARFWTVVLRWVIAAGFFALGWLELRRR